MGSNFKEQAQRLVDQMTVEEAAGQLVYGAPAIERLGIPAYNWWNEALHGVARAGIATVFPQAIGLAAMFDPPELKKVAEAIATEARAKYNAASAHGDRDIYKGLTMWSPNINIFRDPRWGRGHETYGEDPALTARLGVAFIEGLQGDGEHMKAAACAKHFAVHSGPEGLRHEFDAVATPKDMAETYLPAFEAAVKEARVEAVMGAYNRTNGEPCCGSGALMVDLLRGEWGFDGHYVSDCWAIRDFHVNHKVTKTAEESAALALEKGCDLNCGIVYLHLLKALQDGLVTERQIRTAAVRLFTTRMKLGLFDKGCEYNAIPYTEVAKPEHLALALETAEKSIVLLKNDGTLPLAKESLATIGVIGPNAYSQKALYGNYNGESAQWVTNLDGIRAAVGDAARVLYSEGCHLNVAKDDMLALPGRSYSEALAVAQNSDVVVLCVGLDHTLEGEEGDQGNQDAAGDKLDLLLPKTQRTLCEKVLATGKPVIIVVNSGSALDLSEYESRAAAILQCWYSGERGGEALANVLFGSVSPSGRLPLTFYYNSQPLPEFTDYRMQNRTYRYVENAPWFPFGFGLGYTEFAYRGLSVTPDDTGLAVQVNVQNTGGMDGDAVTEVYLRYQGEAFEKPRYSLVAFGREALAQGETKALTLHVDKARLNSIGEDGAPALLDGVYTLYVGGNAPDARSLALGCELPQHVDIEVKGGVARPVADTLPAEGYIIPYKNA